MNHVLECSGYETVKTDMVRGQDCCLYDIQGNRYIDFESGVWCTALGHNHRRINQAIREQMELIGHIGYRYTNDLVEKAAVEFGVQVARRLSGRPSSSCMNWNNLAGGII
jgi:acetylornithine/N-succinyldiaminopimelate aminotransferase